MSLYAVGVDLGTMQAAGAVPTLVRKTLTFNGTTNAITGGTVTLYALYRPLSAGATLAASAASGGGAVDASIDMLEPTGSVMLEGLFLNCSVDITLNGDCNILNIGIGTSGEFYSQDPTSADAGDWADDDNSWEVSFGKNLITRSYAISDAITITPSYSTP